MTTGSWYALLALVVAFVAIYFLDKRDDGDKLISRVGCWIVFIALVALCLAMFCMAIFVLRLGWALLMLFVTALLLAWAVNIWQYLHDKEWWRDE